MNTFNSASLRSDQTTRSFHPVLSLGRDAAPLTGSIKALAPYQEILLPNAGVVSGTPSYISGFIQRRPCSASHCCNVRRWIGEAAIPVSTILGKSV